MRKLLLSFALLVAGAMSVGAQTLADGVYTIKNEFNGRGTMCYGTYNGTEYFGMANITLNGHQFRSVTVADADVANKYWYVTTRNGVTYIYNIGKGLFLQPHAEEAAKCGENATGGFVLEKVDKSGTTYYRVKDNSYNLSYCCYTLPEAQMRWLTNNEEAATLTTFTAVENGKTIYATEIAAANEILRANYWPSYAKTVTVGDRITDFSTVEDGQTVVFRIVNHNRYITIGEDCNAKMSAEVTGFNVFKLHRVGETQTFNFESARKGYYFPQLQNSGWPTYKMQNTSSPVAFEFLSAKADDTALAEGQFVVKSTTANAYFDGNASSFTGWQGKDANCVYEVYKVSCSEDKYFIGDFDFTVIDDLGNSYTGTTRGALGETPTSLPFTGVVGYTFANEEWTNENTSYTANIKFPFAISNENVTNMTTIASFYGDKKWHAIGNDIKVQTKGYDGSDAWLWAIYPSFNDGKFTFTIKNADNGKYVYSEAANNSSTMNKQGTVVLSETASKFVFAGDKDFRFDGMDKLYLSINSSGDSDVYLGVHNAQHSGTDCHFSPSPVKTVVEGLAGAGTAESPYLINNVYELVFFRNSVNAGETTYNAGKYVALGANIDLASVENWEPIGSWDCTFDGNFDGKGHKIMNLKISDNTAANGEAYLGLFGITANNVIKDFVIENVTIESAGQMVAAAIAYPYYTTVSDITVSGDITIKGGNYTAGVLAYTGFCTKASNLTVAGNKGSTITGATTVGGVLADIQMDKEGLVAEYSNFNVSGVTITGTKAVGGITGIIAGQTLNGCSVENVTLVADGQVGIVAGSLGAASTITGEVVYSDVTGADAIIGAGYSTGTAVEAQVGDTYYSTLADAVKAENDVTLLTDVTLKDDVAYASTSSKTVKGKITYTRSLIAGWNPIYLPFKVTLSTEDYDVATFTSAEGETVTLAKIKDATATLNANTAYVIRPKKGAKTLTIELTDATLEAATVEAEKLGEGFYVRGNYSKLTGSKLGDYDRVVGTNGDWGVLKSTSTLKPYRLILTIPATVKAISMRVEGEDVTSIENLGITIEGDVIFDLMGRRVETMTEGGIYIVNGKKIVF